MFTTRIVTRVGNYNTYYSMDMTGQENLSADTREQELYAAINKILNENKFLAVVDANGRNALINVLNITSITLMPMDISIKTAPTV